MSYELWFKAHGKKHKEIVDRLSDLTDDEVLDYFEFDNMVKSEPNFCPLYLQNKQCHNMKDLNCYLCACPNFRFNDSGLSKMENKTIFSRCSINSQDGAELKRDSTIHQDCSGCTIPHKKSYIKRIFSRDWFEIMKNVY